MNRLAQPKHTAWLGTGVLVTSRPSRTRRQSFRCAVQGLRDAWGSEPNLRLQAFASAAVTAGGLLVGLSTPEWLWMTVAVGLVFFTELLNTAIEKLVDLTVGLRPDPLARQVKDVAAGLVLMSCLVAAIIGCLTLLPHLIRR